MDHPMDSMAYMFILVCEHDVVNNHSKSKAKYDSNYLRTPFEKQVMVEVETFVDNLCHRGTDEDRHMFKTSLLETLAMTRYRTSTGDIHPVFRQRFFDNLNCMDNICDEARDMIVEIVSEADLVPPGTCPICGNAS